MGAAGVRADHGGPLYPDLVIRAVLLRSGGRDQHRGQGGETGEAERQGHVPVSGVSIVFLSGA